MATGSVGLRFEEIAVSGPGKVLIDVLAPEGLGQRTSTDTVGGAHTVQALAALKLSQVRS